MAHIKKNRFLTDVVKDFISVRKSNKVSQASLADSINLTKQVICDVEQGYVQPTVHRLGIWLDVMGYELAIVPKGYADFARTVCEQKKALDEQDKSQGVVLFKNTTNEEI